ncbi:hypothetical protein TraAM80_01075 [Trypanosoma rangeli]|uniref:EF-hand domain-containing protein n=1 Tax=Trypanosoma rangeli TaxID=5698 RepID=A0A422P073_TRYRA|nr:uncharacterized protein TraAM80_01075 [Trypanosoma rangeli]RNF11108.1 hypothetical protein TraAM80_01075 [Trypanosoma rangeli]|eukprot:RNF11108.1 hypothetical protein TraAM80_01075 [Trypanosoma rangeli]
MVVSSECQASLVLGVPPYVAAGAFKDITSIRDFGVNKLISCCILETLQDSSTVGTLRRITLDLPGLPTSILRERLASVEENSYRTCVRMDYVPCDPGEAHRSVFGVEGTKLLLNASTFITVTAVSKNPNRCFLEICAKFSVDVDVAPDGIQRATDNPTYRDIAQFWELYVTSTATALEDYLLSTAFATAERQPDMATEKEFNEVEDEYCQWAAKRCGQIPREEAMRVLEKALNAWMRERRELKHQRMIGAQLMMDASGSAAVAATAARALSLATASETSTNKHSVPKQPRRTTAALASKSPTVEANHSMTSWVSTTPVIGNSSKADMEKTEHVPFFSPGGGRSLSPNPAERETAAKLESEVQSAAPPHRPAATVFKKELLAEFLTELGTINERVAQVLFESLDTRHEGFITEQQVSMVLGHLDPLGLYEDQDGTMRLIEEYRQNVSSGNFRNNAIGQKSSDTGPAFSTDVASSNNSSPITLKDQEMEGNETAAEELTPVRALICRHNEQKMTMMEKMIKKRTTEVMSNYAYRTRGKLYYDEFCLMMLHLLKEY